MATIVHSQENNDVLPSTGVLFGAALFLIAVVLALFVILPALSRGMNSEMNDTLPTNSGMNQPVQMDMNTNPVQ